MTSFVDNTAGRRKKRERKNICGDAPKDGGAERAFAQCPPGGDVAGACWRLCSRGRRPGLSLEQHEVLAPNAGISDQAAERERRVAGAREACTSWAAWALHCFPSRLPGLGEKGVLQPLLPRRNNETPLSLIQQRVQYLSLLCGVSGTANILRT